MNIVEIESFLQGDFEIDCPKIELHPYSKDSQKKIIYGSGFISKRENDDFNIKVYFPDEFSFEQVFERLNWVSGKVIDDEFYYNLIAYDISGKTWYAEKFIPDRSSGPNGSLIIGKIPELRHKQEIHRTSNKQVLHLFFNRPLKVHLNTLVENEKKTLEEKHENKAKVLS